MWKDAMIEKRSSLYKNNTCKLLELPKGKKVIGCQWVFVKKKRSSYGDTVPYKAKLVAKGYTQQEGIGCNEVFSPVVKHSSIKILLALVAQYELKHDQLDVKTAYFHGNLDEEFDMSQPTGFKAA